MTHYRISRFALQDIDLIRIWTTRRFGDRAADRYNLLIEQAILDVAEDPLRPSSYSCPQLGQLARCYHLRNSRKRAGSSQNRVKRPRHFLLYRITSEKDIENGRVLHDEMELPRELWDVSR